MYMGKFFSAGVLCVHLYYKIDATFWSADCSGNKKYSLLHTHPDWPGPNQPIVYCVLGEAAGI